MGEALPPGGDSHGELQPDPTTPRSPTIEAPTTQSPVDPDVPQPDPQPSGFPSASRLVTGEIELGHGVLPSSSPSPRTSSPPAIPAPATTQPAETATPAPASTLSPLARPFYPPTGSRSKLLRWLEDAENEDDLLEVDDDSPACDAPPIPSLRWPATYRDAVVSPAAPSLAVSPPVRSPPRPQARAKPPARRRPTKRRRCRQPAELVIGLPVRRSPPPRRRPLRELGISDQLRARLGPRLALDAVPRPRLRGSPCAPLPRGVPRPAPAAAMAPRVDADGFQDVVSRATLRQLRRNSSSPSPMEDLRPRKRIPLELKGKCLNCLSYKHRVATCKLPQRCLRCHGFRHLAKDCKRPRCPPVGDVPRRPLVSYRRTTPPALQAGSQTPSSTSLATQAGRTRRRHPRRRAPPLGKVPSLVKPVATTSGVQVDSSCYARQAAVFETSCFRDGWTSPDHELDPMCLEAIIAGLPQSRGSEMVHHQAKDPEAGAEVEPVEFSTTVMLHRSQTREDTDLTPSATDVLEPLTLELGSPDDGPELPPGSRWATKHLDRWMLSRETLPVLPHLWSRLLQRQPPRSWCRRSTIPQLWRPSSTKLRRTFRRLSRTSHSVVVELTLPS
ncbi:unnamed protein product [Urochloa humidicola]